MCARHCQYGFHTATNADFESHAGCNYVDSAPGYALVGKFVEERIDPDGRGAKRPAAMKVVLWVKR